MSDPSGIVESRPEPPLEEPNKTPPDREPITPNPYPVTDPKPEPRHDPQPDPDSASPEPVPQNPTDVTFKIESCGTYIA